MLIFDVNNRESFIHIHNWFQKTIKVQYIIIYVHEMYCTYVLLNMIVLNNRDRQGNVWLLQFCTILQQS